MIDAALIYLAYSVAVITLALLWFSVGTWLLERRDLKRDAQAIADLIEHEAAERDAYGDFTARDGETVTIGRPPLRLVEGAGELVDARERFQARRRAVARYDGSGAA